MNQDSYGIGCSIVEDMVNIDHARCDDSFTVRAGKGQEAEE
jgi:hypothetical protein